MSDSLRNGTSLEKIEVVQSKMTIDNAMPPDQCGATGRADLRLAKHHTGQHLPPSCPGNPQLPTYQVSPKKRTQQQAMCPSGDVKKKLL